MQTMWIRMENICLTPPKIRLRDAAIAACEAAIEASQDPELGLELYSKSNLILSDETKCQLSIRNSVTEKWNTELIWGLSSRSTHTCRVFV